jgi:hypothetical protein
MSKPGDLDDEAEALLAQLRALLSHPQVGPAADWIDAHIAGEIVTTDEAAHICATSTDTIRRRCDESVDIGAPIGVKVAGSIWLISTRRLLADHARRNAHRKGRDEGEAAAERAKALRSWPQNVRRVVHAGPAAHGKSEK